MQVLNLLYKHFLYISLLALFPILSNAQVAKPSTEELTADDILYRKEFTMAFKLHTHGMGLSANFVKIKNIYKKKVLEIELLELKHPKEFRQQSLFASGRDAAKGFVYGKRNNFYNLNVSWGTMRTISEKARRSGVHVSYYYAGGPSLGLVKPYYLELIHGTNEYGELVRTNEKYSIENEALFLNEDWIYGSSGPTFGWNDLKLAPGLQAKLAVNFDWASYKEFVKAIEVGAMVNAYVFIEKKFKLDNDEAVFDGYKMARIPILVGDNNSFFFTNLYIRFLLGKRK